VLIAGIVGLIAAPSEGNEGLSAAPNVVLTVRAIAVIAQSAVRSDGLNAAPRIEEAVLNVVQKGRIIGKSAARKSGTIAKSAGRIEECNQLRNSRWTRISRKHCVSESSSDLAH